MKLNNIIYILLLLCGIALSGCKNNVVDAGISALEKEDEIVVNSDTFALVSSLQECSAITFTPDSFLLGECDSHFGTLKADILTQLACPENSEYPQADNLQVDSLVLYLYYQNWYGDGLAPLGITVYEMDKATLDYDSRYPSDTTIATFCSLADSTRISERSHIVIADRPKDSVASSNDTYIPCIRIKLTDQFAKRFFAIKNFTSQEAFNQQFKGMYLVSDFGGSTMLYVKEISMAVYYHFTLPRENQQDTTVYDIKAFYANSEVRQVNRYIYPDREAILENLKQKSDTNYIVSPANIYTQLSIPMDYVRQQITTQLGESDNYRVYVNRANLTVDVLYEETSSTVARDQWDMPASYMLLLREDKIESFFAHNELPTDTVAILSNLVTEVDTLGNISLYYSYDLSGLFTHQLRSQDDVQELNFVLVPVAVETSASSSSTVTSVKPLQTVSATHVRSANSSEQPMDIEMVYSGFHKMQY